MQKYAQNLVGYDQDNGLSRRDFLKLAGGTVAGTAVALSPLRALASDNFKDDLSKVVERIVDNGTITQERKKDWANYGEVYQTYELNLPDNGKTIDFTLQRIEDFKRAVARNNPLAFEAWFGGVLGDLYQDFLIVEFKFDDGTYLGFRDKGVDGSIEAGRLDLSKNELYQLSRNPKLRPIFENAYRTAVRKVLAKYPTGRKEKIEDILKKIK